MMTRRFGRRWVGRWVTSNPNPDICAAHGGRLAPIPECPALRICDVVVTAVSPPVLCRDPRRFML